MKLLVLLSFCIASLEADNGSILLYADKGDCKFGMQAVMEMKGEEYKGCWAELDGKVHILFDDGDRLIASVKAFTWRRGT